MEKQFIERRKKNPKRKFKLKKKIIYAGFDPPPMFPLARSKAKRSTDCARADSA